MGIPSISKSRRALSRLDPPHFEDREQQRRANVLHFGLIGGVGLITVVVLTTGPFYGDGVSAAVANSTFASLLLACLAGLWLLRRGHLELVAIGVPGAIWLSLSAAAWWMDGLHGAGVFMYPAIVLVAGFLVSVRAAAGFALLCSLSALGLGLAGDYGLRPVAAPVPTLRLWSTLSTSLVVAVGVVWLALESLQSALRESERSKQKFEDLFNDVPDGILALGPERRIVSINRAAEEILGVRTADAIGLRLTDLSAQTNDSLGALESAISDGGEGPVLARFGPATGRSTWVEINASSHAKPDGTEHVELTLRDVSERIRAEAERRDIEMQLNKSRHLESVGRLAGGIAHDFNNLLTVILGNSELLSDEEQLPDFRERLAEVNDAAEQAASLTSQLLAFASRQVLEPDWIDVNAVAREIEPILARVAGEGIELSLELDHDIGSVRADRTQLQQVLINLVTNARDAMPSGGRVRIDTARAATPCLQNERASELVPKAGSCGWVRLRVQDDGVGMDEETQASAFEPFFTSKEIGRGTGLGLASVHGIVQQSDGHVHVESQVGKGSVFSVYLPEYSERPTKSGDEVEVAQEPGGSETILLFEDEAAVRQVIVQMLERAGYRVLAAGSGEQALGILDRARPQLDLLLTDVVMPGLSGPQLADRLVKQMPELKVVFMSGYVHDMPISTALGDGRRSFFFIPKPPSQQEMLTKLRLALDSPVLRTPVPPADGGADPIATRDSRL